jgi:hypothetical protein
MARARLQEQSLEQQPRARADDGNSDCVTGPGCAANPAPAFRVVPCQQRVVLVGCGSSHRESKNDSLGGCWEGRPGGLA